VSKKINKRFAHSFIHSLLPVVLLLRFVSI
jgi:hypothetical protein